MLIVDKVGRRVLFLIGFSALACCLLAEALLRWEYLGSDHKAGDSASVLFTFIYIMLVQCVDASAFVWASEIHPKTIRAKGLSLALLANFTGPSLTRHHQHWYSRTCKSIVLICLWWPISTIGSHSGWRMDLIYVALCIISTIVV
ncbi:hypothetical protein LTS17_004396 [Exophiala oligosperma]